MKEPSWPVYRVYTHLGGYLDVPGEAQGTAPPVRYRTGPGPEIMDEWKKAVAGKSLELFKNHTMGLQDIEYLAQSYEVSWSPAYRRPEAAGAELESIDNIVRAYANDNNDPANQNQYHNDAWGGAYGYIGRAISILYPDLKSRLDESVDFGGTLGRLLRRAGWSKALRASVDFGRFNRRALSNQEIYCARQIYAANKGLLLIDPPNALGEKEARRYLYEAAGLSAFLGNDQPGGGALPIPGGEANNRLWYGPDWYVLTTKGTTKEPGFVGSDYGEVGGQVYEMGRLANDRRLMDRGIQIVRARSYFRFPGRDAEGYFVMTASEPIGTRNNYLPGHDVYVGRDFGASIIAHEEVPDLTGWFQQQLADGQLYAMIAGGSSVSGSGGDGLLKKASSPGAPYLPDDLAAALAKAPSGIKMPAAPGAPGFAWGDEENMVIAAKHGDELLFVNMLWRGNFSINRAANVFNITPTIARRAEIQVDDIRYVPTGRYETPSGLVDAFANKNPPDNALYPSADSLSRFPIAVRPDLAAKVPERNQDGGRGDGYTLAYGHWLIGLNGSYTTGDYRMKLPLDFTSGIDLVSGKRLTAPFTIPKGTTAVFYLPEPVFIPKSSGTAIDPQLGTE